MAASGSGTVTHSGAAWSFSNVRVGLGTASLALDGRVDEQVDLRFAVATHDLSLLAPGARGELKTSGSLHGTLADPVVVAVAHGSGFEYQGVKLGALDADINFNPGAAAQESKIDARLHELSYEGRTVDSLALSLSGPPAAYQLHAAASTTGLTVSAQASGAYQHGLFQGRLEALNIAGGGQLHLTLERPVDLTLSAAHARVGWLCVVGTPGSICADGDWSPAAWSGTLMANQMPLNTLTAGMTPEVEYLGTITALARLSGSANTVVQGTLRAQLSDAELVHKLASHKVEHTRLGSGTITAVATAAQVSAQADVGDTDVGTIHGQLHIQRTTAAWQDMPLGGELHAHAAELGLISLYVPDIDRAAGGLDADLNATGTLGAPTVSGVVKVTNGEIDVYQVNLSLREVALEARLGDRGIDFSGSARAGTGSVSASGHLEWRRSAAVRQVPPAGRQPARRRRAGSADRCLAGPRLRGRRPQDRGDRQGDGAVREDPA